jgi:plastocyanin
VANITDKFKRITLTATLVGIMGISLAACGGESTTSTGAPAAAPTATTAAASSDSGSNTAGNSSSDVTADSAAQEVKIALNEWSIEPKQVEVEAGKVKFLVSNTGQFPHNVVFSIEGTGQVGRTDNFNAGDGEQTLEVDLQPGTYKMVCDIPGHETRGMVGTLVVK